MPWLGRYVVTSRAGRAAAGTRAIRGLSEASLARHAELAAQGLETGFERRGTLSVYETAAGLAARPPGGEELTPAEARELEPALGAAIAGAVYHRAVPALGSSTSTAAGESSRRGRACGRAPPTGCR